MNLLPLLLTVAMALAQEESRELDLAVRKLEPAAGMRADLFAGEPQLANPVALWVDDRGRVFVAETHRYNTSALYVKQHSHWYFDDLACRTVADREAMARKFMGEGAAKLAVDYEIIRLLEDRAGTGRADTSTVFADGFSVRKLYSPVEWALGSQRRMLQVATVGMCLALWIMMWKK